MIFGLKEMKEFAKSSDDPRVKALWKRLGESMSKNAKWCARVRELERFENIINETGRKFWPAIGTPECRNAIHDPEKRGVFDVLVFINKLLNENSKGPAQGVRDEPG